MALPVVLPGPVPEFVIIKLASSVAFVLVVSVFLVEGSLSSLVLSLSVSIVEILQVVVSISSTGVALDSVEIIGVIASERPHRVVDVIPIRICDWPVRIPSAVDGLEVPVKVPLDSEISVRVFLSAIFSASPRLVSPPSVGLFVVVSVLAS